MVLDVVVLDAEPDSSAASSLLQEDAIDTTTNTAARSLTVDWDRTFHPSAQIRVQLSSMAR